MCSRKVGVLFFLTPPFSSMEQFEISENGAEATVEQDANANQVETAIAESATETAVAILDAIDPDTEPHEIGGFGD